jgi:hypothetical protein
MAKFVWQITARGHWAPAIFSGELPREMTMAHNAGRYVAHDIERSTMRRADEARDRGGSALTYLAAVFPPPPAFTGKED